MDNNEKMMEVVEEFGRYYQGVAKQLSEKDFSTPDPPADVIKEYYESLTTLTRLASQMHMVFMNSVVPDACGRRDALDSITLLHYQSTVALLNEISKAITELLQLVVNKTDISEMPDLDGMLQNFVDSGVSVFRESLGR